MENQNKPSKFKDFIKKHKVVVIIVSIVLAVILVSLPIIMVVSQQDQNIIDSFSQYQNNNNDYYKDDEAEAITWEEEEEDDTSPNNSGNSNDNYKDTGDITYSYSANNNNNYSTECYHYDCTEATCTQPSKCKKCGAIQGSALGHDYSYSNAKCKRCGAKDPSFKEASFTIPSVPANYSRYNYNNTVASTCRIDKISYQMCRYSKSENTVNYTFTFKGSCTYNQQGTNYSSTMYIGYKLYDSSNTVVKSGTMYTETVSKGESFSQDLTLYNIMQGSSYRLELLDVS